MKALVVSASALTSLVITTTNTTHTTGCQLEELYFTSFLTTTSSTSTHISSDGFTEENSWPLLLKNLKNCIFSMTLSSNAVSLGTKSNYLSFKNGKKREKDLIKNLSIEINLQGLLSHGSQRKNNQKMKLLF